MLTTLTTQGRHDARAARRSVRGWSRRTRRRVLGASPVRLHARPDFLIIGAQKAGTTSLYSWLTDHPGVLGARRKELHYFDARYDREPIGAYWCEFPVRARMRAHEKLRGRRVVTGEATPYYLFDPRIPRRVHRHLPDVKLIAVLRDPVDRAVSHYWMEYERGAETMSLEAALAAEGLRLRSSLERLARGEPPSDEYAVVSYVARGMYADQLERWLEWYPRSQLLVIDFGDLVGEPRRTYETALQFLGLDTDAHRSPTLEARRVGTRRATSPATLRWLGEVFWEPNARLADLVGIDFNGLRDASGRPRLGS